MSEEKQLKLFQPLTPFLPSVASGAVSGATNYLTKCNLNLIQKKQEVLVIRNGYRTHILPSKVNFFSFHGIAARISHLTMQSVCYSQFAPFTQTHLTQDKNALLGAAYAAGGVTEGMRFIGMFSRDLMERYPAACRFSYHVVGPNLVRIYIADTSIIYGTYPADAAGFKTVFTTPIRWSSSTFQKIKALLVEMPSLTGHCLESMHRAGIFATFTFGVYPRIKDQLEKKLTSNNQSLHPYALETAAGIATGIGSSLASFLTVDAKHCLNPATSSSKPVALIKAAVKYLLWKAPVNANSAIAYSLTNSSCESLQTKIGYQK